MPNGGRIVAGLNNLSTELLIVRDIQLSLIVEESVKFFSLEKVVNQFTRAFLAEYFKGLSDFNFAIGAVSNLLFKCRGFGKGSGGKHDKVLRV
jgi:hypothetical protein